MTATEIFSSPAIQALGWTLIHSLWQGLVCVTVTILILRFIPSKWSVARYNVATAGLLVILLSSVATFFYLNTLFEQVNSNPTSHAPYTFTIQNIQAESNYVSGVLHSFSSMLQSYLPLIVIGWAIGTALFTVRMAGGWLAIKRLRASAIPVEDQWNKKLQHLSRRLNIHQFVQLAESAAAQAPMVVGYFKPMILMPLGMIGGLSTEQLESIMIHELMHIRRRDYLVNLLQSLLEAAFFFNPFMWIISGVMRREREHCCDDAVIEIYGNRLAYAHALTALEEARLSRAGLALSLAENKNQLLNRIKRIMERSVKPYSLRERIVPAVLLITGLICASWLTISSERSAPKKNNASIGDETSLGTGIVTTDTTIKIEKSGRYYKKSITTIGEDGKPHEEVVEEFDGDQDVRSLFDFPVPPAAAFEPLNAMPAIPAFPNVILGLNINCDTLPFPVAPGFHPGHERDWEEFGREFETRFREKFGDFYEKHENEIEQIMKDLETRFDSQSMEEWAEKMESQAEHFQLQNEELWAQQAEQMKQFEHDMERWSEAHADEFAALEHSLKGLEEARGVFEKEFRAELIKDGYLKDNEEIKSIEINDETIKINDKTIKESHQKKYRELLKKNSFEFSFDMPQPPHHSPGKRE